METGYCQEDYVPCSLFKSYYVVWKQGWTEPDKEVSESLNRTMQYGNSQRLSRLLAEKISLNRTMQYGNVWFRPTREA